jgi:hypothetical protein
LIFSNKKVAVRSAIQSTHFLKASIVALVLIAAFIGGLEYYWRSKGYQLSYNDDKMFWARERRKAYEPADKATVFIGSSRIKWDLDIGTWEKLTGEKAIQLAVVGSPPRKVLLDLANDEKFAGKVVVDMVEPLVYLLDTLRTERFVRDAVEYSINETPAQRASGTLGLALESKFVLLEEGKFGLDQLFKEHSQDNNRKGVIAPPIVFRKEYVVTTSRRQNKFTPVFLNNPGLIKEHLVNWAKRGWPTRKDLKIAKNKTLDSLCLVYKTAIDKIRARGGTVIMVRLPSNGTTLEAELKHFPKKEYWDYMLQYTNTPGIYYADHSATAGLICVENSHLNHGDAIKYTTSLVHTLQSEYGWKFNIKPAP